MWDCRVTICVKVKRRKEGDWRRVLYFGRTEVPFVNAYDNLTVFTVDAYFICIFAFPSVDSKVRVKS